MPQYLDLQTTDGINAERRHVHLVLDVMAKRMAELFTDSFVEMEIELQGRAEKYDMTPEELMDYKSGLEELSLEMISEAEYAMKSCIVNFMTDCFDESMHRLRACAEEAEEEAMRDEWSDNPARDCTHAAAHLLARGF